MRVLVRRVPPCVTSKHSSAICASVLRSSSAVDTRHRKGPSSRRGSHRRCHRSSSHGAPSSASRSLRPRPRRPAPRARSPIRQRRCTRLRAYLRIAANADVPAPTRIRSFLVHRTIAQEWFYSEHNATGAAPATHSHLRAAARTQRLFHAGSRTSLPPPAVASTRACIEFSCSGCPPSFWPPFFAHAFFAHAHARTRPHTRTHKNDRRRTTRRAVRRRG